VVTEPGKLAQISYGGADRHSRDSFRVSAVSPHETELVWKSSARRVAALLRSGWKGEGASRGAL
jgi:hypothetical protein